jgi:hypothetical protein
MKKIIFIIFCCYVATSSCTKVDDSSYKLTNVVKDTMIHYSTFTQPFISNNCAVSGCHVSGGTHPTLTNYNEIFIKAADINRWVVVLKAMPQGRNIPQDDRDKLQKWIAQGALNN